ncbi:MAG: glycosyltransferase family 4 protein [Myxococcota bacterium]|nr:glycosyltransferase family 4 protein [Myxococcota bacterium]
MSRLDAPYTFLTQSTNDETCALAQATAEELGGVVFHLGTPWTPPTDKIQVRPAPQYRRTSILSRLWTWSLYMLHALWFLLRRRGPTVLVLNSNPPLLPLWGWFFNKLRGWPYVVTVLDIYPDALVSGGVSSSGGLVYRIWSAVDRLMYDSAASVITLGDVMRERLSRHVNEGVSIDVIPTWVDTDELKPIPRSDNPRIAELGLEEGLTVLYSGNLGLTHSLEGLAGAMERTDETHGVRLLLVGGGGREGDLRALSERLPERVNWLPFQPREWVPQTLSAAHVGLSSLGRGTEGISMPSKTYYLMAAGCAVLGLSHGDNDLKRLIERYECGLNVEPDDPDGVLEALKRFRDDPDFLAHCQSRGRQAAEEQFSATVNMRRYLDLLASLGPGRG